MTKNESSEKALEESNRFVRVFLTVVVLLCIGFIAAMWWAALQGMQKPPASTPPLTNWQWAALGAVLSLLAYWLFPRLVASAVVSTAQSESDAKEPGAQEAVKPAAKSALPSSSSGPPAIITIHAPRERALARPMKASNRPKE